MLARDSTFGPRKRDDSSGRAEYVDMEEANRTVVRGNDPARRLQWTMVVHLPSPDSNPVILLIC
jgi:hypothetical protein